MLHYGIIVLYYGIIVLYYGIIVLHYGIIVLYYGIIMNFYTFPVYIQEVKPVMKNGCQLFYGPTTSGILKRCTRIWWSIFHDLVKLVKVAT